MNKKGFTLIELLSVIVLLSLLMGVAIPGISRISNNAKKKSLNTKIKLIESAAVYWGQDNRTLLRKQTCDIEGETYSCYPEEISDLIENDYLDEDKVDESGTYIIKNPINNKNIANCDVNVYKKNNRVYASIDKNCIELKNN